jgi:soluble lytic murein transglycosylase
MDIGRMIGRGFGMRKATFAAGAALLLIACGPVRGEAETPATGPEVDRPWSNLATSIGTTVALAAPPARTADEEIALRKAVNAYEAGRIADGDSYAAEFRDPALKVLAEWLAVRRGGVPFARIAAFLEHRADWPSRAQILRRAEEALLADRIPAPTVRAFFAQRAPSTPQGQLVLAQALLADGEKDLARAIVIAAWRREIMPRAIEERFASLIPDALGVADHRARLDMLLFREQEDAALRAAQRAGADHVALLRARVAVENRARNAAALIDAVPKALQGEPALLFARVQHLRRQSEGKEAARLIASLPPEGEKREGDGWWVERRLIARQLLDHGEHALAYEVARGHQAVSAANRIEAEFHAGWIALRFLSDGATARTHFDTAATIAETPISVARAAYWQGRAAERLGDTEGAQRAFTRAAAQPTAYYGQLARARLGLTDLPLRPPPPSSPAEVAAFLGHPAVQSIRALAEIDERSLAMSLKRDFAQTLPAGGALTTLGELARALDDPRAQLAVGKIALQRGLPLEWHAFPTSGVPAIPMPHPGFERALVHAIARQESAFDIAAQSSAGARGLMQLMPATARETARRSQMPFDLARLTRDGAYNAQLGAHHLVDLLKDHEGSLVLTIAAYNAGGGNVRRWLEAYGDPRRGGVDVIDWIERIPFAETRNYVQRVLENLQVYRQRFGGQTMLMSELDLQHDRNRRARP